MTRFYLIALMTAVSIAHAQTTITLQPDANAGKDAELWSLDANTNYGSYPELKANSWTWSGSTGLQRALLEFDLSQIPANATIQDAQLYLYGNYNSTTEYNSSQGGSNAGLLQRVTDAWDENSATWNNQPASTTQDQVNIPQSTSQYQDYQLNVTTLLQDIITNASTSHGFLIKLAAESDLRRLAFSSSDNSTATLHPKLVVTYLTSSDTCFTTYVSTTTGADAEIWDINPTNNYGTFPELKANAWTWSGTDGVQRGLLKFDMGALPAGAVVTSAKLSLFGNVGSATEYHSSQSGSNASYLQRVTQSWDANTVTWSTQPTATTQNEVTLPQSTSQYEDYLNADVTNLVNDMITNGNHGFLLRLADETSFRRMAFKSGDNGNATLNPKLDVCYSMHSGVDHISASALNATCFPNPFTTGLNVSFTLAQSCDVRVQVYNALGQFVYESIVANATPGLHTVSLNTDRIASGVYNVVVKTDRGLQTVKVIGLAR